MPGNTVHQNERTVPKKNGDKKVTDLVEILRELDRRRTGSIDTAAPEAMETREAVGMTCDNYFG